jgi:hypothetical protein
MDIEEPITHVAKDELTQILAMGIFELLTEAVEVDERILVWIHAYEGALVTKKHI